MSSYFFFFFFKWGRRVAGGDNFDAKGRELWGLIGGYFWIFWKSKTKQVCTKSAIYESLAELSLNVCSNAQKLFENLKKVHFRLKLRDERRKKNLKKKESGI